LSAVGQQLTLESIDDYLGPGDGRFFSRGYQRARYGVRDITVAVDEQGGGVTAEADVHYPADWSTKKKAGDLRPHLSTVDALVLGVQLAEIHLGAANCLDAADRRETTLRKVVIRSGNAPQEDLRGIRLAAAHVRSTPVDGTAGRVRSVYDTTVGALQVRCDIEHPAGRCAEGEHAYGSLDDALGPGVRRFYGEAFKQRRHSIEQIRVDLDALVAEGTARFRTTGSEAPTEGIDGSSQPAVSLIDCFVVNLQLAQVLMYELDSVRRDESNTLWMMKTVLESAPDPWPLRGDQPDALPARTAIVGKRLLPLRGGTWRSVDLHGGLAGITMRCAFAHELPAGRRPATD